jgi:EmrB/QacA subfamily drug resistance transporter
VTIGTATARRHLLTWGGPVQQTNRIERNYRWWALASVLLVMFSSSLSGTIVSTAVPTIVGDLHGFTLYAWVFTGYMLASTVAVPIAGKLSDVYGRRPFYLWGIGIFVVGSVLAGLAQSMLWLIAARVVAGIGGGALMALSTATIGDIFSPRERGRWMGIVMGVFGLSSIIGPTLGGTITDNLGWRWVFFITLPLVAVAWLIVGAILPRVRTPHAAGQLDIAGSALITAGLVAVLLGFTWGGTNYAWGSWQELLVFVLGGVLLVGLGFAERRAPDPLLSPTLFRNRVFALSVAISFLISVSMFGGLTFIPLFVQGVVGKSAQNSGVVLTPMMLSFVAGSAIGGQIISRTGRYRLQAIIGMAFGVAGMVLFSRLGPHSGSGEVIRDMVVLGLGIGTTMPIFSMTVQSAFPHELLGTVNAARQLFSNLGAAIAIPLMTAVVVNTFSHDLGKYAPAGGGPRLGQSKLSPQTLLTPGAQAAIRRQFAPTPHGQRLYGQFVTAVRHALSNGISDVFAIGIGFAVAALLLTLVFPHIELTTWDDAGVQPND